MNRAHRFATALVGKARAVFHRLGPKATIACAYALIGLGTFGHAAANAERLGQQEYSTCKKDPKAYCFKDNFSPPVGAFMAAMLWPLYWSWEAQS